MSRVFGLASILSLGLLGVIFVIMLWGWLAPTELVMARWGSLWQLYVDEGDVHVTRVEQWPRNEPLIRTGHANRLILNFDPTRMAWMSSWCCGVSSAPARVRTSVGWPMTLNDPWSHRPRLDPALMTTILLIPNRCFDAGLVLPMLWLVLWYARNRRWRPGLCRVCLYDLRASPTRCPECGAPAVVRVQSPAARRAFAFASRGLLILLVGALVLWLTTAAMALANVRFGYASPDERITKDIAPSLTGWGGSIYVNLANPPPNGIRIGTMDFPILGYRHRTQPAMKPGYQSWFDETYEFKLNVFELAIACSILMFCLKCLRMKLGVMPARQRSATTS